MIAICPSCHDEVHHGRLGISDETLLRWKNMPRSPQPHRDQLFTGPASRCELLIGGARVIGLDSRLRIFELLNFSNLQVQIADGDLVIMDMEMRDLLGKVVAKMRSNHLTVPRLPDLDYARRNGRMRLTAPALYPYLHPWALRSIRAHVPHYAQDGRFNLLDLEIFDEKTIRVEGAWMSNEYGIIATSNQISLVRPTAPGPMSICTEQPGTAGFVAKGFVNEAFFNQMFGGALR